MKKSPWTFIPTLYFSEAVPCAVVMLLSVVFYKEMGLTNTQIAFWTGIFNLPWLFKPFWSPLIEFYWSKKSWIVVTELICALIFCALAVFVHSPSFFSITAASFFLIAIFSATHDVASDGAYLLALNKEQQAYFVGLRNSFYRLGLLFCQGGMITLVGFLEKSHLPIKSSYSIAFTVLASVMTMVAVWHLFSLPKLKRDNEALLPPFFKAAGSLLAAVFIPIATFALCYYCLNKLMPIMQFRTFYIVALITAVFGYFLKNILKTFTFFAKKGGVAFDKVFYTFFQKESIGWILFFLLTFRLAEAQLVKMAMPFLLDSSTSGGLGLSTANVGVIYGGVGVVSLLVGGILGGFAVSYGGLKKWLIPMWAAMNIPDLLYYAMASYPNIPMPVISLSVAVEQLGYGFGFSGYMLYMVHLAKSSKYETAHYAVMTGIMTLGLMLPGMISGAIQEMLGYQGFFVWVLFCTLPGLYAIKKIPFIFGETKGIFQTDS